MDEWQRAMVSVQQQDTITKDCFYFWSRRCPNDNGNVLKKKRMAIHNKRAMSNGEMHFVFENGKLWNMIFFSNKKKIQPSVLEVS